MDPKLLLAIQDFASSPLGHFLLVGLAMLFLSRWYPAIIARWPALTPIVGILARYGLDAAPRSGEAVWELYRAKMGGRAVNGTPLPSWADLDPAQRAAYKAMAQGLALAPPTTPSKPPPAPPAPPGVATMGLVCLALWVSACAGLGCGSPITSAIVVANAARDAAEVGREELQSRCVDGYRAAQDTADIARLDGVCLPLRDAYRGVRGAHLGLVTAIQVAEARGDVAALVPAVAATVEASELLARALSGGDR